MRNIQRRTIAAPPERVGSLIDRLAGDDDPLWPTPAWPPLRLDHGLTRGSTGGHGPIPYFVSGYEPSRRIRFTFAAGFGIRGYHEFRVEEGPTVDSCVLVHDGVGTVHGGMRLGWPLVVRWMHEALIQDLLDNAELAATGRLNRVRTPRYTPWVRLLRRLGTPQPQATDQPDDARLLTTARAGRPEPDLADAWRIPLAAGMPTDPRVWADAIFRDIPPAVLAVMALRNLLVRLVGIAPGTQQAFAAQGTGDREHLLGSDDKHLDFRVSVHLGRSVIVSTAAWVHNRRGRLYLVPVRVGHPIVVRAMLRRAQRRLADAATPAGIRNAAPASSGAVPR